MSLQKHLIIFLLFADLLSACSTLKLKNNFTQKKFFLSWDKNCTNDVFFSKWYKNQKLIEYINYYQFTGTFIYFNNKKKFFMKFSWKQFTSNNYHLFLINPFGMNEIKLYVKRNFVQLTDKKGKSYIGNDPEKIIFRLTGINIPIYNLQKWILGLPGNINEYELNSRFQLYQLYYKNNNQIWKITWKDYNEKLYPKLPSNIELISGNKRINIKIKNWTFK